MVERLAFMQTHVNIALSGKSGSGKTLAADYLVNRHGYFRVSTGDICRSICWELYGLVSNKHMNLLAKNLTSMDEQCLINAALRRAPKNRPIVFDSIRLPSDYRFVTEKGFLTVRLNCDQSTRWNRMEKASVAFDKATDEKDANETALDRINFSYTIDNSANKPICDLHDQLTKILFRDPGRFKQAQVG